MSYGAVTAAVPPATSIADLDLGFMSVVDDNQAVVLNGKRLELNGALALGGTQAIKHFYASEAGNVATFLDIDALELTTAAFKKRNFFWTDTSGGCSEEWYNGTSAQTLVHRLAGIGTTILGAGGGSVNVGFDTSLHPSAVLGATSTTRGFLPPVMLGSERDAIASPTPGLMVYNTTAGELNARGASGWLAMIANPLGGVAAGYRMARGETALDGSNPTTVATGLTTIVMAVACLKGTVAPGVGTSHVTYDWSGANLSLYGWKPTATGDCTLIASTGTETVGWVAIGT